MQVKRNPLQGLFQGLFADSLLNGLGLEHLFLYLDSWTPVSGGAAPES